MRPENTSFHGKKYLPLLIYKVVLLYLVPLIYRTASVVAITQIWWLRMSGQREGEREREREKEGER